jgi:hypothetical protein
VSNESVVSDENNFKTFSYRVYGKFGTWIDLNFPKKSNFVKDHSMIIYVLFGINQHSGFWEKKLFSIFPYGPIYVKNMPCVGDQLGFRIQKKT